MPHYLHSLYDCFCATAMEWNSCDRDPYGYLAFVRKNLPTLELDLAIDYRVLLLSL